MVITKVIVAQFIRHLQRPFCNAHFAMPAIHGGPNQVARHAPSLEHLACSHYTSRITVSLICVVYWHATA
jgi:hypothetical protein